jgi:hypothetical protein
MDKDYLVYLFLFKRAVFVLAGWFPSAVRLC